MIIIAVLLAIGMGFTMHSAAGSLSKAPQMPPGMQNGQFQPPSQDNSSQDNSSQDHSSQDDSSQNNSDDQQAPNSNSGSSGSDNSQPNDSAPNDNGNSSNGAPPDANNGNHPHGNSSHGAPPTGNPPDGAPNAPRSGASMSSISAPYYILFGIEGLAFALVVLYLIFSGMNRRTMRTAFASRQRIAVFVIAAILAAGGLTAGQAALASTAFASGGPGADMQMLDGPGASENGGPGANENGGQNSVEATGATTVDGTEETLNDSYTSTNADENAVLVKNGGKLTSDGATITKESGDSSNTESSDFSGVNSGLLVQENSTATVKNATINTSAKGANAVFATGENAKITISDSTIKTTGEASSRGLDATYGGTIKADNVEITTQGGSCAAMATDRGEGTVTATNSKMETNGAGSPIIYSTGDITLTDSEGTANGAQITVVEGKNSATIENSKVICSAAGNRGDVDIAGVMVYQSMSGDADEGTGNFTAKDSTLTISKDSKYYKNAPMFFVTNTNAVIDLQDTDLNFGSGVLLSAKGTSEWGKEGSNGGDVTFKAADQALKGDIELDKISTLDLSLTGSTYKGTINGDNSAKSVTLSLDKKSKITLTGDSYVTSLEDADSSYSNIDFNGYTLYVDGKAVN